MGKVIAARDSHVIYWEKGMIYQLFLLYKQEEALLQCGACSRMH